MVNLDSPFNLTYMSVWDDFKRKLDTQSTWRESKQAFLIWIHEKLPSGPNVLSLTSCSDNTQP